MFFKNKVKKRTYILFIIFIFGIMSGLPFLLILSTLNLWLLEIGFDKVQIGFFSLATIPYSFKFLFGPYVDYIKLPFLYIFFGQKRSWLIVVQIFLMFSILLLSLYNSYNNFFYSVLCVFFIGFFSAIQDVILEAYKIELLKDFQIEFGLGSMIFVLGYRFGMLISGPGALYFSFFYGSWSITYFIMSLFVFFGILIIFFFKEPKKFYSNEIFSLKNFFYYFVKKFNVKVIISFILLFKFVDTALNVMTIPFLIEIGFSKIEVLYIVKIFGMLLVIFGSIFGGFFLKKNNIWNLLLFCCFMQIIVSCMFFIQSIIGYNVLFLFYVIAFENLMSGMSQVAIITYFSYLCYEYTATCYAVLSSFYSFMRVIFSFLCGFCTEFFLWDYFYLFTFFICFFCIFFLFFFKKHFLFIKN